MSLLFITKESSALYVTKDDSQIIAPPVPWQMTKGGRTKDGEQLERGREADRFRDALRNHAAA